MTPIRTCTFDLLFKNNLLKFHVPANQIFTIQIVRLYIISFTQDNKGYLTITQSPLIGSIVNSDTVIS